MKKCVRIEVGEDGQVSVGLEPQAEYTEEQDSSYLEPARNIESALQVARDLLATDQAQEATETQDFESGFDSASGPDIDIGVA